MIIKKRKSIINASVTTTDAFLYDRRVDMITKTIPQMRAITGSTPQETAALFNQAMVELADLNPTYERDGGVFWVYYTVITKEPETTVEEHEMNGEHVCCVDCPYLMRDLNRFGGVDGRKKWATCGKTGERTNIDSTVCEEYYKFDSKRRRRF